MLLDHVTTYTDADDAQAHLAHYRRAGFVVPDHAVAHANGVLSRTISLGGEYIEILEVVDAAAFNAAPMNDKIVYRELRPFAVGLKVSSIVDQRARWLDRGIDVPEVERLEAHAPETGARVVFQIVHLPLKTLRGASCFVLEKEWTQPAVVAPNGVHALAAITLVSSEAADRAAQWHGVLVPDTPAPRGDHAIVTLGHHRVHWLDPEHYAARMGRPWQAARHPLGEIAAIHLLSEDLTRTRGMLMDAGRTCVGTSNGTILVQPHPLDNLVFVIHRDMAELEAWMTA